MNQPQWITDRKPALNDVVQVRLCDEVYPVWPAFYVGYWCYASGDSINCPVLGWMTLEDAAAILDGPSNKALAESLK